MRRRRRRQSGCCWWTRRAGGLSCPRTRSGHANNMRPCRIRVTANAGTMTFGGIVVPRDNIRGKLGRGARVDDGRAAQRYGGNNVAACQDVGVAPGGPQRDDRAVPPWPVHACGHQFCKNGELRLFGSGCPGRRRTPAARPAVVVARCALRLTRLRVYVADLTLDGRALSTFLNRRGCVSDMRLSMHSSPPD